MPKNEHLREAEKWFDAARDIANESIIAQRRINQRVDYARIEAMMAIAEELAAINRALSLMANGVAISIVESRKQDFGWPTGDE